MTKIGYLGSFERKQDVRILVVNPVSCAVGDDGPVELSTDGLLAKSTRVDEVFCPEGPVSIDNSKAAGAVAHLVVEKALWAERQGYDGVLVNCMLDPGLKEAKASVSIPVVGLGQASNAVALLVGETPSFFDPEAITVAEYGVNPTATYELLLEAGRRKVNFQGADVLVPNCAYLGGLAGEIQEELGVPVIANRDVALKIVELITNFKLKPEAKWVAQGRSKTKIFLTKLYRTPFLGPSCYRFVQILARLR